MPRAKGGPKTKQRRKKVLKMAKGYYGARSRIYKMATQAVDRALLNSYKDRRLKKRNFRSLWIVRINAGVRALGLTYGQFMKSLKKLNVQLDRKSLADMAYHDPDSFLELVEMSKKAE